VLLNGKSSFNISVVILQCIEIRLRYCAPPDLPPEMYSMRLAIRGTLTLLFDSFYASFFSLDILGLGFCLDSDFTVLCS